MKTSVQPLKSLNSIWSFALLAVLLLPSLSAKPQTKTPNKSQQKSKVLAAPKLDSPAPDLNLKVITPGHQKPKQMSLKDFSGKWLVLEFWTRSCIACIQGLPKLDKLQQQFSKNITFLPVGKNDARYGKGIELLYQRVSASENLKLLSAFDTVSFTSYAVQNTPHVAIISPEGKLYAVTVPDWLEEQRLTDLIQGKKPVFPPMNWGRQPLPKPSNDSPSLAARYGKRKGQGYQSQLTAWTRSQGFGTRLDLDSFANSATYSTGSTTLSRLYMLSAFGRAQWIFGSKGYGAVWPRPILNLPDTSLFVSSSQREQGLYNYSLDLGGSRGKADIMRAMQKDLKERLGLSAVVEQREMPVLELIITDRSLAEKAKSSDTARTMRGGAAGYSFKGIATNELLERIGYFLKGKPLLFDESNISFRLDLDMQVSMINLSEVRKALAAYGLDLRPAKRKMPVLVIGER